MKKTYLSLAVCYGLLFAANTFAANNANSVAENYFLTDPTSPPQTALQNGSSVVNEPNMPMRSYNTTAPAPTMNAPAPSIPNYGTQTYQSPAYGNTNPSFGNSTLMPPPQEDNQIYTAPLNPNLYQSDYQQASYPQANNLQVNYPQANYPSYQQTNALSGSWQATPNQPNQSTDPILWNSADQGCQSSTDAFRYTGQNSYDDCDDAAPEDQALDDCYCLNVHYRPCYYYTTEVSYIPKYQYLRCCRFIPEQYNVTRCKEETENYSVMRCKYVEEPYYVTRCRIIKEPYYVTRCKMHSEAYYEPRFCYCEKYNEEKCCCEPTLHQYQQTCYKDVPEYYQELCFRDVPQYYQITCCKKVPQYYQVTCCRKVPRYYDETCCRYVPQYYYMVQCKYCPQYKYKRQCKYIPQYYYKHNGGGCAKADMVMADDCTQ